MMERKIIIIIRGINRMKGEERGSQRRMRKKRIVEVRKENRGQNEFKGKR